MMQNKKAQSHEILPIILWFGLLLGIILISIVGGLTIFFGQEYDFRQADASLLNEKISSCIQQNPSIIEKEEISLEELLEKCRIDKTIEEKDFLIQISKNNKMLIKIGKGDVTQCQLAEKNKNFPKCALSSQKINDQDIQIITGSNQHATKKII